MSRPLKPTDAKKRAALRRLGQIAAMKRDVELAKLAGIAGTRARLHAAIEAVRTTAPALDAGPCPARGAAPQGGGAAQHGVAPDAKPGRAAPDPHAGSDASLCRETSARDGMHNDTAIGKRTAPSMGGGVPSVPAAAGRNAADRGAGSREGTGEPQGAFRGERVHGLAVQGQALQGQALQGQALQGQTLQGHTFQDPAFRGDAFQRDAFRGDAVKRTPAPPDPGIAATPATATPVTAAPATAAPVTDPAVLRASLAHARWSEGQLRRLNQQLALVQADYLRLQPQVARAFGRARVLEQISKAASTRPQGKDP